jgi:CO/xanthine dehydrogenase FAD-binding subunit
LRRDRVKPAPFTHRRATSTREAVDMLAAAEEANVLGGGQSLVIAASASSR